MFRFSRAVTCHVTLRKPEPKLSASLAKIRLSSFQINTKRQNSLLAKRGNWQTRLPYDDAIIRLDYGIWRSIRTQAYATFACFRAVTATDIYTFCIACYFCIPQRIYSCSINRMMYKCVTSRVLAFNFSQENMSKKYEKYQGMQWYFSLLAFLWVGGIPRKEGNMISYQVNDQDNQDALTCYRKKYLSCFLNGELSSEKKSTKNYQQQNSLFFFPPYRHYSSLSCPLSPLFLQQ